MAEIKFNKSFTHTQALDLQADPNTVYFTSPNGANSLQNRTILVGGHEYGRAIPLEEGKLPYTEKVDLSDNILALVSRSLMCDECLCTDETPTTVIYPADKYSSKKIILCSLNGSTYTYTVYEYSNSLWSESSNQLALSIFSGSHISYNPETKKLWYSDGEKIYPIAQDFDLDIEALKNDIKSDIKDEVVNSVSAGPGLVLDSTSTDTDVIIKANLSSYNPMPTATSTLVGITDNGKLAIPTPTKNSLTIKSSNSDDPEHLFYSNHTNNTLIIKGELGINVKAERAIGSLENTNIIISLTSPLYECIQCVTICEDLYHTAVNDYTLKSLASGAIIHAYDLDSPVYDNTGQLTDILINSVYSFNWPITNSLLSLYIGLFRVSSTYGRFTFKLEIFNSITKLEEDHLFCVYEDTPPDSTFLFMTSLSWPIKVRINGTTLSAYLEVPAGFAGTVSLLPIKATCWEGYYNIHDKVKVFDPNGSYGWKQLLTEAQDRQCALVSDPGADQSTDADFSDRPTGLYNIDILGNFNNSLSPGVKIYGGDINDMRLSYLTKRVNSFVSNTAITVGNTTLTESQLQALLALITPPST